MENAVATQNAGVPAVNRMQGEEFLAGDMVIPKALLMQGLSDFVAEGKFKMGDIVRSTTEELLGGKEKRIDVIPITFRNMWRMEERVPGESKMRYRGTEPRTAGNDHLPWEFKKNGVDWKRVKVIELFGLLPQDIDVDITEKAKAKEGQLPDLDKTLLPVAIAFRSTGFQAGKAVSSHFMKAAQNSVKPYLYSISLGCFLEKNDKGTFYVWDVGAKTPPIDKKYYGAVEAWAGRLHSMVASGNVQVDESLADDGETAPTTASGSGDQF